MTEKKTETSGRPGRLAWQKARQVLPSRGRLSRFANWPDAFTVGELAALQYPGDEKSQRAMIIALRAAVKAGEIRGTVPVQQKKSRLIIERFPETVLFGQLIPAAQYFRRVSAGTREEPAIPRNIFAAWLADQGEEPSEHIRAWLADAQRPKAAPAGDGGGYDDRNQAIYDYHAERKAAKSKTPTTDTAKRFGISPARVRQIIQRQKPASRLAAALKHNSKR